MADVPMLNNMGNNILDCDHCGTVERALTLWPADIVAACPCACHQRRKEHDSEATRKQRKKGAR